MQTSIKTESIPIIKICVLGSCNVGKTQLCNLFVSNYFDESYEPTRETHIYRKLINIKDKIEEDVIFENEEKHKEKASWVVLEILDVFGANNPEMGVSEGYMQQAMDTILENKHEIANQQETKFYIDNRQIDGYMFVFDLTDRKSFEQVFTIAQKVNERELERSKKNEMHIETHKLLVGNKKDKENQKVSEKDISRARSLLNIQEISTSALENFNVSQAFRKIAGMVYYNRDYEQQNEELLSVLHQEEERDQPGFFSKFWNIIACGGCGSRGNVEDKKENQNESKSTLK